MLSCGPSLFRSPRVQPAAPPGPTDPDFSFVVALHHFFETAGSTSYADTSAQANTMSNTSNTQTAVGGPFGNWLRVSTGTPRAIASSIAAYDIGTQSFVWEWLFNPDAVQTANVYDLRSQIVVADVFPTVYTLSTGELIYFQNNTDRVTSAAGVITAGNTTAICYQRDAGSNVGRLYANGASVGTWTDAVNYTGVNALLVIPSFASPYTNANYAESRLTVGVTRYGASYTPAVAAFPDS